MNSTNKARFAQAKLPVSCCLKARWEDQWQSAYSIPWFYPRKTEMVCDFCSNAGNWMKRVFSSLVLWPTHWKEMASFWKVMWTPSAMDWVCESTWLSWQQQCYPGLLEVPRVVPWFRKEASSDELTFELFSHLILIETDSFKHTVSFSVHTVLTVTGRILFTWHHYRSCLTQLWPLQTSASVQLLKHGKLHFLYTMHGITASNDIHCFCVTYYCFTEHGKQQLQFFMF